MPKRSTENAVAVRHDGWKNLLTSFGVRGRDPHVGTMFAGAPMLTESILDELYRADALARKIVDLPAREMTREWFDVEGDQEGLINSALEEIDAKNKVREWLRTARLHGGGLLLMLLDDRQEFDKKVSEMMLRKVEGFQVYSRWRCQVRTTYRNPKKRNFEQPETYEIFPITGRTSFLVHESRVLRMDGTAATEHGRQQNQGWSDSVLTALWPQLKNCGAVDSYSVAVVRDFVQGVMTIDNLAQMIGAGQEAKILTRLNIIDLSRSILNTILLDKNETYTKVTSTVAGLPDLIDRHREGASAAAEMPSTLLWGRPPAGLSTDDEAGMRNWYDRISGEQEDSLQPALERLVRYMQIAKDGPMRGREIPNWAIKFRPLFQLSEKDDVALQKTRAETDKTYIENGVLDPQEVRMSRFGSGKYGKEIAVDDPERAPEMEAPEDEEGEATTEVEAA